MLRRRSSSRSADVQEIIRSECTREKSRSCVTRAAALIASAPAVKRRPGASRIRTAGPAPAKGSAAGRPSRTPARKPKPVKVGSEAQMASPGPSHSRFGLGGTTSSNPSSSSGESRELPCWPRTRVLSDGSSTILVQPSIQPSSRRASRNAAVHLT
jgi:hypothetical protein